LIPAALKNRTLTPTSATETALLKISLP